MRELNEVIRALRFYSSSALGELKPRDLQEWAGISRHAIALLEALKASIRHP